MLGPPSKFVVVYFMILIAFFCFEYFFLYDTNVVPLHCDDVLRCKCGRIIIVTIAEILKTFKKNGWDS